MLLTWAGSVAYFVPKFIVAASLACSFNAEDVNMKMVLAIIRPHRLQDVKEALAISAW